MASTALVFAFLAVRNVVGVAELDREAEKAAAFFEAREQLR